MRSPGIFHHHQADGYGSRLMSHSSVETSNRRGALFSTTITTLPQPPAATTATAACIRIIMSADKGGCSFEKDDFIVHPKTVHVKGDFFVPAQ